MEKSIIFVLDDRAESLGTLRRELEGRYAADYQVIALPFALESSLPGVFAVGNVRHGSVKRVASAVGEGAMGVQYIHYYPEELATRQALKG